MLASAIDTFRVANWQRTTAKPQDFPWPLPRPGVEPQTKTVGGEAIPMDEMAAWLGWDTTT